MLRGTDCSDSMSSTLSSYLGDAAIMLSFSKGSFLCAFHSGAMVSAGCTIYNIWSLHEQWRDERNEVYSQVSYCVQVVIADQPMQARG